jgi:hypothetical protein
VEDNLTKGLRHRGSLFGLNSKSGPGGGYEAGRWPAIGKKRHVNPGRCPGLVSTTPLASGTRVALGCRVAAPLALSEGIRDALGRPN